MIISDKHKYIFIAIPKTGSTTIQNFLRKNDDSCRMNCIQINNETIRVDAHIETKKLKKIMGKKFDEYVKFTFIRNPYSRVVSSYFFYKNGKTLRSRFFIRNLMARLNIILTRIFPFSVWSIIKPQKKMTDYLYDNDNQLLINLVGKTENLNEDLLMISKQLGISVKDETVPFKNKSTHSSVESYYSNKLYKKLYSKILKKDLKIYDKYCYRIQTENYHPNI